MAAADYYGILQPTPGAKFVTPDAETALARSISLREIMAKMGADADRSAQSQVETAQKQRDLLREEQSQQIARDTFASSAPDETLDSKATRLKNAYLGAGFAKEAFNVQSMQHGLQGDASAALTSQLAAAEKWHNLQGAKIQSALDDKTVTPESLAQIVASVRDSGLNSGIISKTDPVYGVEVTPDNARQLGRLIAGQSKLASDLHNAISQDADIQARTKQANAAAEASTASAGKSDAESAVIKDNARLNFMANANAATYPAAYLNLTDAQKQQFPAEWDPSAPARARGMLEKPGTATAAQGNEIKALKSGLTLDPDTLRYVVVGDPSKLTLEQQAKLKEQGLKDDLLKARTDYTNGQVTDAPEVLELKRRAVAAAEERLADNFALGQERNKNAARRDVRGAAMADWLDKNPGKGPSDYVDHETAQKLSSVALSPEGLESAAQLTASIGRFPERSVGTPADRVAIINRAAKLMQGGSLAEQRASYGALSGELAKLQSQQGSIESFAGTADKNLDLFLKQAKNAIDTGSPWINKPLREIDQSVLGSSDQAAINAARTVALTEIANVVRNPSLSGSGGALHEGARQEVLGLVPEGASLAQIYAVADVLKKDMANRKSSIGAEIAATKNAIKGLSPTAPPAAGASSAGGGLSVPDALKALEGIGIGAPAKK